jgi:phenylalanine-4-hydroxylase
MAIESENVSTLQYSSGLQVSGVLSGVETGDQGEAIYLQFTGPSALAYQNIQITGHGTNYHKDGFGSPVGKLSGSEKPLELFNNGDLEQHCSKKGNRPKLIFSSGIVVEGEIEDIKRNENMIQLISFKDCQVKDKKGEVLFKPEWGTYDMAVGEKISSVFAGTADKENYNVLPLKSEEKAIEINYTTEKKHLFSLYQQVRDMRENVKTDVAALSEIEKEVSQNHPEEWLLHLEIIELVKGSADGSDLRIMCMKQLEKLKEHSEDYKNLIIDGLTLLNVKQ